jgi:mRNA interferase MazF
MKTRRGDVVLVLFPNSDLRTAKRRPALILQRDNLGSGLEQTIVAMISSNLARRGHPSRIFVAATSPEGQGCRNPARLGRDDGQCCDCSGARDRFSAGSASGYQCRRCSTQAYTRPLK